MMEYQGLQLHLLRRKEILASFGHGATSTEEPLESLRTTITLQERCYIATNPGDLNRSQNLSKYLMLLQSNFLMTGFFPSEKI